MVVQKSSVFFGHECETSGRPRVRFSAFVAQTTLDKPWTNLLGPVSRPGRNRFAAALRSLLWRVEFSLSLLNILGEFGSWETVMGDLTSPGRPGT